MIESISNNKIHIAGSCVTQDIFRVLKKDNLVGQYALIVADANHQWKLASFRYIYEYSAKWSKISAF